MTRRHQIPQKSIAGIVTCVVAFVISLLVLLRLFGLEFWDQLPELLTVTLPLGLAWAIAAGVGSNFISGWRSLALATVLLLIAAPLVLRGVGEPEGWEPEPWQGVENVPESQVAFRFVSSFTYEGGAGTITNVRVSLPWPYVDGPPASKPLGVDNWLEFDNNLKISAENQWFEPFTPENWWWITTEGGVGVDYRLVDFPTTLRLYSNSTLEMENDQIIELIDRPSPPMLVAYVNGVGPPEFPKVIVEVGSLKPGETIAIEGVFQVARENASRVRLDDYWMAMRHKWIMENTGEKYEQENAPEISLDFKPNTRIHSKASSRLEKWTENGPILVTKYWEDAHSGPACGFIDDQITK